MNKQRHGRRVPAFQTSDLDHSSSLPSHHQRKNNVSPNICPTCEKSFERLYNLKVHLRKHTGETPYDCPVNNCRKQFKWRSSMAHHVRAHHDPSELLTTDLPVPAIRYPTSSTVISRPSISDKRRESIKSEPQLLSSGRTSGIKKTVKKKVSKQYKETPRPTTPPAPIVDESGMDDEPFSQLRAEETKDPFYLSPDSFIDDPILPFDEESERIIESMSSMLPRESHVPSPEPVPLIEPEPEPEPESEFPDDPLDESLLFLAVGSEDATDAEMESLAQFEGHYTSPEDTSSASPLMVSLILP